MAKKEEQMSLTKANDVPGAALLPRLADPNTDIAMVRESLGPEGQIGEFDLQRLRVPSGGVLTWQVDTLNGPESRKTIEGVVVAQKNARAYWSVPYGEGDGNMPPDCTSEDGVTGSGNLPMVAVEAMGAQARPHGPWNCADCPFSKFGSAQKNGQPQRGQACKQVALLFVMQPDDILPSIIAAPPTSLKALKQFRVRLVNAGIPYWRVKLKFRLDEARNAGGIKYGQIQPFIDGTVKDNLIPDGPLAKKIEAIREVVMTRLLGRAMVERRDVESEAQ